MSYGKFYLSFMASMVLACCAIADDMKAFSDAAKLSGDGKFKEAYDAYVKLLDDPQNSGRLAADILTEPFIVFQGSTASANSMRC